MSEELKPCPFCGGEPELSETRLHPRMDGKPSAVISVEVRHWCTRLDGNIHNFINFRGRDKASAIAAWNRRAPIQFTSDNLRPVTDREADQ